MSLQLITLRNQLLDHYVLIRNVLVILLILSSIWTYGVYIKPQYVDKKIVTSHYTQSGNYEYFAKVTESNPLYPVGTELGKEQPAYFFTVSPALQASFSYTIQADSVDLDVEQKTMVVATAKGSANGTKAFWQKKFLIEDVSNKKILNNEPLTHSFIIDVPDIQSKIKQVQDQLKYSHNTEQEIVTTVTYQGTINGKSVSGTKDYAIPLTLGTSYYQLPEKTSSEETINEYGSQKVKIKPPFFSRMASFGSFLFLFGSITALGMFRTRYPKVDQYHIDILKSEMEHESFKDWISEGIFPNETQLLTIKINSIEDLVNLAMDMNSRVIYDQGFAIYFTINDGVLYIFRKDVTDENSEFDEMRSVLEHYYPKK